MQRRAVNKQQTNVMEHYIQAYKMQSSYRLKLMLREVHSKSHVQIYICETGVRNPTLGKVIKMPLQTYVSNI